MIVWNHKIVWGEQWNVAKKCKKNNTWKNNKLLIKIKRSQAMHPAYNAFQICVVWCYELRILFGCSGFNTFLILVINRILNEEFFGISSIEYIKYWKYIFGIQNKNSSCRWYKMNVKWIWNTECKFRNWYANINWYMNHHTMILFIS